MSTCSPTAPDARRSRFLRRPCASLPHRARLPSPASGRATPHRLSLRSTGSSRESAFSSVPVHATW
eukprot:1344864-Prymnesium_polylepis.1